MLRAVLRSRQAVRCKECGPSSSLLRGVLPDGELARLPGVARKQVRGLSYVGDHTSKWLSKTSGKTPMELIAEVPPISVKSRIVACEGLKDPALGHPVEYICLDLPDPAVCKYCGLRYVQDHGHGGGHH